MRTNGFLKYEIVKEVADFNEYGEPDTEAAVEWSEPVPCSIKTNSDNRKGKYEDGEFRVASFVVLIEEQDKFSSSHIYLERSGEALGEYRIQATEALETVGRIQITV
jgi:hypothetical protein